mgnify:CR=1 FL=1
MNQIAYKRVLLKLSGEALAGDKKSGIDAEVIGKICDQVKEIVEKGVEVAIFAYEIGFQKYKVSLRSNECVDVSRIALNFGGGGHIRAAGCTINGQQFDVINSITYYIEQQLDKE